MDKLIQGLLSQCTGFEWDEGNSRKNWMKHKVTPSECEQIYFNQPLIVKNDNKHSKLETRYYALGKTDGSRKLFIAFTVRNNLIRVISARDMSRKEREAFDLL
jgi:uncharacterized protein